jgi:hypothetical protein
VAAVAVVAVVAAGCSGGERPRALEDRTPTTPSTVADLPAEAAAFVAPRPDGVAFTATYEVLRKLGAVTTTVEVAQAPPVTRLTVGDVVVLDGPRPATCRLSAQRCVGEVRQQVLAPFGLFSEFWSSGPREAVATLVRRADASWAASERTVAGQAVTCLEVAVAGSRAGEWCRTAEGVFAVVDNVTLRFELEAYAPAATGSFDPPGPLTTDDGFLTAP